MPSCHRLRSQQWFGNVVSQLSGEVVHFLVKRSILQNVGGIVPRRHGSNSWQHVETLLPLRLHHEAPINFQSWALKVKLRGAIFLVDINLTNVVLLRDVLKVRACVDGRWRDKVRRG